MNSQRREDGIHLFILFPLENMALPKFNAGQDFNSQVNAKSLNAICDEIRSITPKASSTIRVSIKKNGALLETKRRATSSISSQDPFTVVTQSVTSGGVTSTQWGVVNNSPIYSDLGPNDFWNYLPASGTAGGLLSANYTSTDGAWINMAPVPSTPTTATPYDVIYLQVAYNSDGTVNTSGTGSSFTGICSWGANTHLFDPTLGPFVTKSFVENDGATPPNFLVFRKPIAYATGTGTILQMISQSQIIFPVVIAGYGANYPIATDTGYPF